MDNMLRFDSGNRRFNFRSVAVLIEQGHVLLHRSLKDDFWALPGGRVEFFERSSETVTRELVEEIGVETEVLRMLWLAENFFAYDGCDYHEVGHFYLVQLNKNRKIDLTEEVECLEEGSDLVFRWFPLEALDGIELEPKFLQQGLNNLPSAVATISVNELKIFVN